MKKPAIFIDAFIDSTEKKTIFDYNLSNFIKNDWDVFIISNKMLNFDKFSDIKYFEYDSHNRLLLDRDKYKLISILYWNYQFYYNGRGLFLHGKTPTHGFTNWTILYNLKRICKVLKRFGYDYMIRYEYDVVLKNYDLMNTIFKDFGKSENSKNCMIMRSGGFACATNFFLINVDYLDSKIPELETEDDYINFMHKLYGDNSSAVFEDLFNELIYKDCEYMSEDVTRTYIENLSAFTSDIGELGYRHKVTYKSILMTPVNNKEAFIIFNSSNNDVYINYTTFNSDGQLINTLHLLQPKGWIAMPCKNIVEIKTSEMPVNKSVKFDLINEPCYFTLTPN